MIVVLSILSLIAGVVVLLFTIASDPGNSGLWIVGLLLLGIGAAGFAFNYYRGWQRKKAAAEQEQKRRDEEARREAFIRSKAAVWGEPFCEAALAHEIQIGMMPEIVVAAWGEPSSVEEKTITATKIKKSWTYETPGGASKVVWFTDGRVSRIEESP